MSSYRNSRLPAAVIFDMDGVLVDSEPLHAQAHVEAFAEFGMNLDLDHYLRTVPLGEGTVHDLFSQLGGDESKWHSLAQKKAQRFKKKLEADSELQPGVIQFLELLTASKIPVALATSAGNRSLNIVMNRFGIASHFLTFVTADDVKAHKPNPAAYLEAARRLSVPCEECVAVEDTARGVLAVHRANMKCLAVPTAMTKNCDFLLASLVVKSLEEVTIERLRRLF